MSTYIDDLNWRYATKKFDPNKKISTQDLDTLLTAAQLSASSYGLQPYQILVVEDAAVREKLKPASWNQSQITDASHLIVIANKTDFGDELVDDYLENVSTTRGIPEDSLNGYGDFMKSKLLPLPQNIKANWTARQAYIILGNLLSAAANLRIDTCPMEGFEAQSYNELLKLDEKNLNAAVVLAVGYRSEEDDTQHYAKVRKSKETLITHI